MTRVDLNADVGEGCGADAELFAYVSSANVACGWHAGDETTMRDTVRLARNAGVAVGAHPSFPDREHFGRTPMQRSPEDVYADVVAQVGALAAIALDEGVQLRHVKPHGALYNQCARDAALADAVARAVCDCDPRLALVGLAGSESIRAAREAGLRAVGEGFADRGYDDRGALIERGAPGSSIDDEDAALAQAFALVERGIESICLHGDGPHAAAFARRIREAFERRGVVVRAPA